ncbi:transpeptidase [Klebsiella grimontii]|uniref:Transpeptidase n=1 Tax=Klebsiella grimontii TaxID=2058152 RepID=A0A7H4P9Q5_9ENTR|nr:transpeptidase [Klebsiella grimontii]
MRKIALFIAMLLLPCVSFAGLLSSNSSTTPMSKEYKQQLMGSPVYIEIFKEERMLDLYVKMGETYQLLDSYRICNYSGGLGPKQRQGDFKSPEGFYNVSRNQLKPDSRFYKAINIGFPNAYDRAHGYEGKYLMIHGACVSVGCYAMTDTGIDEIFQFRHRRVSLRPAQRSGEHLSFPHDRCQHGAAQIFLLRGFLATAETGIRLLPADA